MSGLKPWRELAREPATDCRVFTVERSLAESPHDGSQHSFYRICAPDWAQIVPETAAGEIVMVRQYRHGSQRISLEIPSGIVERGEGPAEAALRECLEETGYRATTVVPLGVLNPNPALFANKLYGFYATGVERVAEIRCSGTEHTEVVLVPRRNLVELITSGRIDHALVVPTLWRYVFERLGTDGLEPAPR